MSQSIEERMMENTKASEQGSEFFENLLTGWKTADEAGRGVTTIDELMEELERENMDVQKWGERSLKEMRKQAQADPRTERLWEEKKKYWESVFDHYTGRREMIADRAGGLKNLERWLRTKQRMLERERERGMETFKQIIEQRVATEKCKEAVEREKNESKTMRKERYWKPLEIMEGLNA